MLVFFAPFYLDCQDFLFKRRKSEGVVFNICSVLFLSMFRSRILDRSLPILLVN